MKSTYGVEMKLPQYERSWRGIEFAHLPVCLSKHYLPDAAFFTIFYEAVHGMESDKNRRWKSDKIALSDWLLKNVIDRFARDNERRPKILSVGVGEAIVEERWLQAGCNITLNECQQRSLDVVRAIHPDVPVIIGRIQDVAIPSNYDIIFMLNVDYCLEDHELAHIFKRLERALANGGVIVHYTSSAVSLRKLLAWLIRRFILVTYAKPCFTLWGYYRSPGLLARLARHAGLVVEKQLARTQDGGYRQRNMIMETLVTLRETTIITLFVRMCPS